MIRVLLIALILFSSSLFAQNKITLLNGKIIPAKNVELRGTKIIYHTPTKNKLKKISSDRAFSIEDANGKEQIIYQRDPLEPTDFDVNEMRIFIRGEQDADRYYRNQVNKGVAAIVGAGAGILLNFYGVVIPALYSTVIGNIPPNYKKQQISDESMRDDAIFREGYERRSRDRKIRNTLIYGYGGFFAGFIAFAAFFKK